MTWLARASSPVPLEVEIRRVEAALRRYHARLDDYDRRWPPGECCPSCWFGRPYQHLVHKIERVEAWLLVLRGKR